MGIDLDAVRADTPACETLTHLNNAGAALPPQPVLESVIDHLRLEARLGGYEAAAAAAEAIDHTYDAIAALLGCGSDEIALAQSATAAWHKAFSCFRFQPGDRVLVTRVEYVSNVLPLLQARAHDGVQVEVIPSLPSGETDADALAAMLDDRVRLVAATHVPTQGGIVNDVESIGRVARSAGVPFLLDACQAAGQLRLDVDTIGCDFLCATGRKFLRAPRGTGFLYARAATTNSLEPGGLDYTSADWSSSTQYAVRPGARRFEQFEHSVAGLIGLGVAVDYALRVGIDDIEARVRHLADVLRSMLQDAPGVTVHDQGRSRAGIVTFTVAGHDPDDLVLALRADAINVSASRAGSARFDLDERGIDVLVRASPHYYNTTEDLERLVAALPPAR